MTALLHHLQRCRLERLCVGHAVAAHDSAHFVGGVDVAVEGYVLDSIETIGVDIARNVRLLVFLGYLDRSNTDLRGGRGICRQLVV